MGPGGTDRGQFRFLVELCDRFDGGLGQTVGGISSDRLCQVHRLLGTEQLGEAAKTQERAVDVREEHQRRTVSALVEAEKVAGLEGERGPPSMLSPLSLVPPRTRLKR